MAEFWDRRAREDAFYFVDNRLRYGADVPDAFWAEGREDLDRILGRLEVALAPTDDVIEIGCGVGRLTQVLAERAATVRALDVSALMLELAKEHNRELDNVAWIHGDGASLRPLADHSADVCFSHVVFQHIPDPAVTLGYVREIGRVLRAGGWSAFQVSNQPAVHAPAPLPQRLRTLPGRILRRAPRGQSHPAWLGSSVDLGGVEQAAEDGGCELERVEGRGTQWCLVLLRKRDGTDLR